jgi:hypothetical protein
LHDKVTITMFRSTSAILAAFFFSLPGSLFAFTFEGPFQVKNQFPLFLPIDQPYLERAATEDSLSLSLSHSSVFVMNDSAQWSAHLDLELTELNIRYKKDFAGLIEVGVDVPILRATAGFLDSPLEWYHETFGFDDYGRSSRPKNAFLYDIKKDGSRLIEGDNDKTGFGDVRFTFKKKLIENDPVISLIADIELPTGNAKIGYGNGSVDAGIAVLLDKDLGSKTKLYTNLGAVFPGDLKAHQRLELDEFFYAGTAVETLAWSKVSLIAQLMLQTSPYPHTGISEIDNSAVILVLGGRYYFGSGSFELSLTEDVNTSGAPDFILNVSYKKRL